MLEKLSTDVSIDLGYHKYSKQRTICDTTEFEQESNTVKRINKFHKKSLTNNNQNNDILLYKNLME